MWDASIDTMLRKQFKDLRRLAILLLKIWVLGGFESYHVTKATLFRILEVHAVRHGYGVGMTNGYAVFLSISLKVLWTWFSMEKSSSVDGSPYKKR